MNYQDLFPHRKPIIGMVHLPPLPSSPGWDGRSYDQIYDFARADALALVEGGADGLIIENQHDFPFSPGRVDPITIAYMAALSREIRRLVTIPIGVNVLFNDWQAELAVAEASGARFIRVEVLVDPSWSDMGFLDACAPQLLRLRSALQSQVLLIADIQGKYTSPARPRPLEDSARDAAGRGMADALIVTGSGTGHSASLEDVRRVKEAVDVPVWVGSGVTPGNIGQMLSVADGAIIGSYFKTDGKLSNPVDPERVRHMISAAKQGG